MVDAKVDPEVIKTYIKSSPTAYHPSAAEIIALKDQGIGPEILTAMLQHGADVRAQAIGAAQMAPPTYPGAVNPYAPAPGYDEGAQPGYPSDASGYPAYSYAYPSDVYAYPAYSYGYLWPYGWPYFYCGLGGYGYGYPYYWGGRGYYGRGYHGAGARSIAFAGSRGGFHSFSTVGRAGAFARPASGFRFGGGMGGRSVSFASHSGGGGHGGHVSGRGR
jgi:hypothetical protein